MNNILIGLANPKNLQLIKSLLDDYYHVTQYRSGLTIDEHYDLIIMDGRTLSINRKRFQLFKKTSENLFQPVLFISGKKNLDTTVGDLWHIIDEIVTVPIKKAELFVRIETLLRARRLSMQMKAYNAQLETENNRLNKESKMLIDFFSNISHEFRTPLSVIFACIDFMNSYLGQEDVNPEKCKNSLTMMKQNSLRLQRLIANLLDLTKINSGSMELSLSKINIVQYVYEIVNSVQCYAKQKQIYLSFITDLRNFDAAVDEAKFDRILLNLLSNAIKYTNKNGQITVKLSEKKENRSFVISVKDNGAGVPLEKQEKIFERFAQADNSFIRKSEGCGLGLSLAKSLVELHGGSICVESTPGKGSTFSFELPVLLANDKIRQQIYSATRANSIHMEFSCL